MRVACPGEEGRGACGSRRMGRHCEGGGGEGGEMDAYLLLGLVMVFVKRVLRRVWERVLFVWGFHWVGSGAAIRCERGFAEKLPTLRYLR